MALDIEYSTFFKSDLPAPSQRWSGFPEYNFIGGHNDAESIPVDDMIKSISEVLKREGKTLATYGLQHGPQGYKPLREFISKKVNKRSGLSVSSDDILITRERHRQHLQQCLDHLKNFNKKNEIEDFDKAAEDLRLATRHLGMIVGKVDVEEILGSIFNDFCIGK